jgi:hypothetical protein
MAIDLPRALWQQFIYRFWNSRRAEGKTSRCPIASIRRTLPQSETPGTHGNSTRENRETPSVPAVGVAAGRLEKAMSQESNMHAGGESDGCVVCAEQTSTLLNNASGW